MNWKVQIGWRKLFARLRRSFRRLIFRLIGWSLVFLLVAGIAQFLFGFELPFGLALPPIVGSFLLGTGIVAFIVVLALTAYLTYAGGKWGKRKRQAKDKDNKDKKDGPSTWSRIKGAMKGNGFWKVIKFILVALALLFALYLIVIGWNAFKVWFAPYGEGNDRSIIFGRPTDRITVPRDVRSNVPPLERDGRIEAREFRVPDVPVDTTGDIRSPRFQIPEGYEVVPRFYLIYPRRGGTPTLRLYCYTTETSVDERLSTEGDRCVGGWGAFSLAPDDPTRQPITIVWRPHWVGP